MRHTIQGLARTLALSLVLSIVYGAHPLVAQSTAPSAAADSSEEDLINADRPGIADGSRVIAPAQVQLEVGAQRERHVDAGTHSSLTFAPTLLRIGIVSWLEARVESNTFAHERVTDDAGAVATSSGISPALLGFKAALYDSKGEGRRSVGAIVRVAPPSGSDEFRTMHTTGDVRLAGDWDFAPKLSLNPNVGVARNEDSDGALFTTALGALTLSYLPTERLNTFVDAAYQSLEQTGGTWSLVLDAGVAYIVGRDVQLDVSVGQGVHGDTTARPFVAVGVSARTSALRRTAHSLAPTRGDRSPQSAR